MLNRKSRNLTIIGGHPINEGLDITWNLTNYCNYRCPYCLVTKGNEFSDKNLIHEINDYYTECNNIRYLVLFGGEPTYHPELEYVIEKCKCNIKLWTNLSQNVEFYKKLSYINKSLYLVCTYHSDMTSVDEFINKLKLIRKYYTNIDCHIPICYNYKQEYYDLIKSYVDKCETIPIVGIDNYYKDIKKIYTQNYETDIYVTETNTSVLTKYDTSNYLELDNLTTELVICDRNKYNIDLDINGKYRICTYEYNSIKQATEKPIICIGNKCNVCFLYVGKKKGRFNG